MALSNTTVNGTSVPGLLTSITSGSPSLGAKATSPATNTTPKTNTIPTSQTAQPKDLSGQFANVNGTIYNKTTNKGYSTPEEFYSASGVNSFNNVKFDTAWQPPQTTPTSTTAANSNPNTGILPTLATTNTNAGIDNKPATTPTTSTASPYYTPPNQGTTGVSQGGLIGNLTTNAINNPKLDEASTNLQKLQNDYADATSDIHSRPEGLSQQTGQQGILQQLYATKLGAAQTAVSNALSGQANTTSGLSAAAGANAPIVTSPGQVELSPSQPNLGATTSGAGNISALVGQRTGADGKTTEFFDTQTGKGFASPQALADFINKQYPGTNANASNVFQIYDQLKQSGGSNVIGLDDNLMSTYAQMLVTGQGSAIPSTITGNTVLMGQLVQKAKALNPSFDVNTAAGIGAANQSNATTGGTVAVNAAASAYPQYYKDYTDTKATVDNIDQFGDLLFQNAGGLNPFVLKYGNATLSDIRNQLSSQQQAQFDSTFAALKSKISGLLAVGGSQTPTELTNDARSILDGNASISSLQATLNRIKQEGQIILNLAATKGNTALQQAQGGSNTSSITMPTQSSTGNWNW